MAKQSSKNLQKKRNTKERREKIYELIKKVGLWNLDKKALADLFGVSLRTIYTDIHKIVQNIDVDELNTIRFIIDTDFKQAESEIKAILRDKKVKTSEKLKAIELLMAFAEKYTKFLEAYGLKEKVAEKLSIEATTLKTLEDLYNEYYGGRRHTERDNQE